MIGSNSLRASLNLLRGHWRLSYAQEGEDLILQRLFSDRATGFYVDVGAHHPRRFSNTFLLYRRGWRGINIDAMPGSMASFRRQRARDINIEAAIAESKREMTFYIFNEPALNTFDAERAQSIDRGRYHIVGSRTLTTRRLDDILSEATSPEVIIDLLSIDVEGLDLQVLRSNNWTCFRPVVVLVEVPLQEISEVMESEVYRYMVDRSYALYAKTANSLFFRTT